MFVAWVGFGDTLLLASVELVVDDRTGFHDFVYKPMNGPQARHQEDQPRPEAAMSED
ncbi:MAG: hypothetical protein IPL70_14415 [Uliginosibacterium sp.]|nr:hypothetical protein [Uliginosibacterium sp.]